VKKTQIQTRVQMPGGGGGKKMQDTGQGKGVGKKGPAPRNTDTNMGGMAGAGDGEDDDVLFLPGWGTAAATLAASTTDSPSSASKGKGKAKKPTNTNQQPQPLQPPQQQLGCPQCLKGRLVQKCKDTFRWRERLLVCEKVLVGQAWVGGCGYTLELENGPSSQESHGGMDRGGFEIVDMDAADAEGCTGASGGNTRGMGGRDKEDGKRRDTLGWTDAELRRAWANPLATAVPAAAVDRFRKKVVVDLTEGEEKGLPGSSSWQTLPASSDLMVGGKPVLFVEDDEPPAATVRFEELSSDDERELIKMADRVGDKLDDLDAEDELELIELADRASGSMPPQ
jgi:hypothetical protein